jgi:alanine racemase
VAAGVTASPLDAYRPTWAEIDLDALSFNLSSIRARVGGLPLLAVVKADAYGHGAATVAPFLEKAGVGWFGVALPEEGIELRQSGVKAPILLLGGLAPGQADMVLAHDLTPAVFRADQVEALGAAAARRGREARAHLKIDTGVGRLGVPAADVASFAAVLQAAAPRVRLTGAFSHLAVADDPGDPFTSAQIDRFARAIGTLRERGLQPELLHLANSAAILDHPPAWLTMARPGIILYGYRPSPSLSPAPLRPVLSLMTRIIYMKEVPPGTPLGYGRTYVTKGPARIASLAIGYDDGLPRLSSNRGQVLVQGRRAPIVGRVSMDLTTIDVSGIPEASLGDQAVILGSQGAERIGADEVADWAGTISWEILCGVGARVPRVYVRDGMAPKVVSRFALPLA